MTRLFFIFAILLSSADKINSLPFLKDNITKIKKAIDTQKLSVCSKSVNLFLPLNFSLLMSLIFLY